MLIQLTRVNGDTVAVNPAHIVYIEPTSGGQRANVYLTTREMLQVEETREQIEARLGANVEVKRVEPLLDPPQDANPRGKREAK